MRAWQLIRQIEDCEFIAESYDGVSNLIIKTPEGWRFEVFIDSGEPDYLHWVEPPGEERIDFWAAGAGKTEGYLAGNVLAFQSVRDKLLAAAKKLPNWDY